MAENSDEETICRINKAQVELKVRLEQVSKLRIEVARMQLELLKLYKPQCLEILETLQSICEVQPDSPDDDGRVEIRL